MRTNPPAEKALLRDERRQVEDSLNSEMYNDSLEDFEDEDNELEGIYGDEAVSEAWGFGDGRRSQTVGTTHDAVRDDDF